MVPGRFAVIEGYPLTVPVPEREVSTSDGVISVTSSLEKVHGGLEILGDTETLLVEQTELSTTGQLTDITRFFQVARCQMAILIDAPALELEQP